MKETETKAEIQSIVHNYGKGMAADKIWRQYIEPVQSQLATAEKQIGRLNNSIKARDGAIEELLQIGEAAHKKLDKACIEVNRLRDALDYDKRKLENEIIELLVCTQFWYWIKKTNPEMTAREARDRKKQAIDYYRGCEYKNAKDSADQCRFHAIVKNQCHHIRSYIEQALQEKP